MRFAPSLSATTLVMTALSLLGCSSDSSTSPQAPQAPALEGTWRYPKAGGSDANLFRFTLSFSKDSVTYKSYLDGARLDSTMGIWSQTGDTISLALADSIDFGPSDPSPKPAHPATISLEPSSSRIQSLKCVRSGMDLLDPLHRIELGKQ